jgi:hypothetical protein
MNSSSTYLFDDQNSVTNPPGLITRAIVMATFYTVTALTEAVLWIISPSRKRTTDILAAQHSSVESSRQTGQGATAASNVIDFQRYKQFNPRRR